MKLYKIVQHGTPIGYISDQESVKETYNYWTKRPRVTLEEVEPTVRQIYDYVLPQIKGAVAAYNNEQLKGFFPVRNSQCPFYYTQEPELIHYFRTDEDRKRLRVTSTRPGRYLTENYPELTEVEVAQKAARWRAVLAAPSLKLAHTAEEIEKVYRTGPGSCMSHSTSDYNRIKPPVHPTAVYGEGSDLAVAYCKRDGRVNARAVVWPDKKIYGRLYGDAEVLTALLEKEGYKSGPFYGAKLAKIPHGLGYVMAYLDNFGHSLYGVVREDHIEIVSRERKDDMISLQTQYGGINCGIMCQRLNTLQPEEGFQNVMISSHTNQNWSAQAVREHAGMCVITDCLVANEASIAISNGRRVANWKANKLHYCSGNGEAYLEREGLILKNKWYSNDFLRERIKAETEKMAA